VHGFDVLTVHDAPRISELWNRAQPAEPLTATELTTILDLDPGIVLSTDTGVVATTTRADRGFIRLLAVAPEARNRGQGRALLTAAEAWLTDHGVTTIRWGSEIPYYLWPGLDEAWKPAVTLATTSGYTCTGTALNMTIHTDLDAPKTLPVHRIGDRDPRITATRRLIQDNWAPWLTEVNLAATSGTLFVAFDGDRAVSFMAHSTLRRGWLGPMGTDPDYQGRGIGTSVLQATCADLASRGFETAEIAWVGPTDYFARFGATRSRTFLAMVKTASHLAEPGS
jgi:GNAT superfamily N-acetyltransferase